MEIRPIAALRHASNIVAVRAKWAAKDPPETHPREPDYATQMALYATVWGDLSKQAQDRIAGKLRAELLEVGGAAKAGASEEHVKYVTSEVDKAIAAARAALEA